MSFSLCANNVISMTNGPILTVCRIFEEEIESSIDARTEVLNTLRELGPPDLVHLVKQPIKSSSKQVCFDLMLQFILVT